MANLQVVISALNKASGEINKVKAEIKGVGDSGKVAEGGVKGFGASLSFGAEPERRLIRFSSSSLSTATPRERRAYRLA